MIPEWTAKYKTLKFIDCDCWQLACRIYEDQLNYHLPFYKGKYKNADDTMVIGRLVMEEQIEWQNISKEDRPNVFDIALFSFFKIPCHIGIVIDPRHHKMIHTVKKINCVIEDYTEPYWWRRLNGFFRHPQQ